MLTSAQPPHPPESPNAADRPLTIPVARPLLPRHADAARYYDRIDETRIYSNRGPLALGFEERLAVRFGLGDAGCVATMANGTLGLVLALMALKVPAGSLCLMPAWTFVATAHAARLAQLVPYLLDVSREHWTLSPDIVRRALPDLPGRVGAVLAVSPFGAPVDGAAWDGFAEETGIPVVIDAAAGFDGCRPCRCPTVLSLHATKALGIGEGGVVLGWRRELIAQIHGLSNFGFRGSREAALPALNAKLSEHHAAIGHAALDRWPETRAAFARVAAAYARAFAACPQVALQPGFGAQWVSSTCVVELRGTTAGRVAAALAQAGVDTRFWWGRGLHHQPAYSMQPHAPLPVTDWLAAHTLGLPFYLDLDDRDIDRIAAIVCAAAAGADA